MKGIVPAISLCLSIFVHAGEVVDFESYYGRLDGQVFKTLDMREFQIGFREGGGGLPILTWEGLVAGRRLYVEMHVAEITLISEKRHRTLQFNCAYAFPDEPRPRMDFNSARIFVASGQEDPRGVLSIEAYDEDVHLGSPFKEVYVILDPMGKATLFKMPRRNASSAGLRRTTRGGYIVPESRLDNSVPLNLEIQYYLLTQQGFRKEGSPVAGRYLPGDDFHFELVP